MANKPVIAEKKQEKPKIEIKSKPSFFNKKQIAFSLIVIGVSLVDAFDLYGVPRLVIDILAILAGVWLLKLGLSGGYSKRRKEIFKKYI